MDSNKKIKVAMVAPPFGDTGGPEVATQDLTNALLELNVDVTLFAPADFKTKAKHVHTLPKSLWNTEGFKEQTAEQRRNARINSQMEVLKYQNEFDIIHLHSQKYAHLVGEAAQKPCVLTFHNKITQPEFDGIRNAGIYTVATSNGQKKDFPISAVINNGLPTKKIQPEFQKGAYLIMIGRITHPKGIDVAIEIAKKARKKLLIFGHIGNSPERQAYFEMIRSLCDENIIYKGEASHDEIFGYLKNAEALLFTTRVATGSVKVCPLVVMEALACGTPVIATPIDYVNDGFANPRVACISDNIETLIEAAKNTDLFDRELCRKVAQHYFDSSIMAQKYLELYKKIMAENAG